MCLVPVGTGRAPSSPKAGRLKSLREGRRSHGVDSNGCQCDFVEPNRLVLCMLDGDLCMMMFRAGVLEAIPGQRLERIVESHVWLPEDTASLMAAAAAALQRG